MFKVSLKEVFISFSIALVILLGMESASRLIYTPSQLDKIQAVLEEDQSNLWKVKSNLDQLFFGANITTNSDGFRVTSGEEIWQSSKVRLAVLGASPSFGWGVRNEQTYSSKIFQESNQEIAVKNFSQIGYSSFQGLKVLEKALKAKPTHLLITYVINDLDYYRFFYSENNEDKDVVTANKFTIEVRKIVQNLTLTKLIYKKLSANSSKQHNIERKTRVTLADYILNIGEIVKRSRKAGVTPILVKFPVNIPIQDKIETDYKNILNSKIRERSFLYNNQIHSIAKQMSAPLLDFTSVVEKSKEYLFLDPNGDTIHPNAKGHSLFAHEVLNFFKKI